MKWLRVGKVVGSVLLALLLVIGLLPVQLEVDLAESHSLSVGGGQLKVFLWGVPRFDPHGGGGPDCWTIPLWLPLLLLALPTLLLWWGDRRAPGARVVPPRLL